MPEPAKKGEGLYKKYMRVMGKVGDIQGRAILTALYMVVFSIPGVAVSGGMDKLQMKRKPTSWMDRTENDASLERARDQW